MNLQVIISSINLLLARLLPPLINLIYALILLLIGLIVAKIVEWIVVTILKALQLDKGSKQIGFTDILVKGDIKRSPSELVGELVYWLTILVTVVVTAGLFGITGASSLLDTIFAYVPIALSAAFILAIAIFVADVVEGVVVLIAANAGLSNARSLGKIVEFAIIVFAAVAAISKLGIDPNWLIASVSVIVGAVGLACAIAFGLGCKDMAADFLSGLFKK